MSEVRRCAICNILEPIHSAAEQVGEVNHRFSVNGELYQVDRSKKSAPPARTVIANAVDVQLRDLLISKGVLTYADFGIVHDPGSGPAGDSRTGAEATTG